MSKISRDVIFAENKFGWIRDDQEWWQVGTRLVPDWYQIDRFGLDIGHHGGGCRTRSTAINHTLPHASMYDRCGTAVHLAWVPLFQHIIAFLLSMSVSHARMMGLLFQFPDTTHLLGSPYGELILAPPKIDFIDLWQYRLISVKY